ncbi:MAG: iron ABC transporter substrate-binding protein [Egibacteraceae bacterium]
MKRMILLMIMLTLLSTGCSAFGGGDGELVIYSGRTRELIDPLLTRFSEETSTPIAVKYGTTQELAITLAEEGDRSQADVFISQAPGATGFLLSEGMLAPLPASELGAVPERFRGPDGEWVGLTARLRVLVYNSELVAESDLPRSVFDLAAPEYAGRVGIAPTNASFQDFVTAMRQIEGDERTMQWLRAMAEEGSPTYANNNAIVEAVSRGEIPMGLVNHYYNERFLAEDPSLPSRNYVFPDGDIGSVLLETTASVLRTSDQSEAAARFIQFLLSDEAQRYFADETFEYPLVEGVPPATDIPDLGEIQLPNVDLGQLGEGYEQTTQMIRESGLAAG